MKTIQARHCYYLFTLVFLYLLSFLSHAQATTVSPNSRGERKIAAILINFQDAPDDKPYTPETIKELIGGKVNDFYVENSYGQTWLNVDTFGWFTLPLDGLEKCPRDYREYANAAVEASGVDLSVYPHLLYIVPKAYNACNGSFGSVGGSPSTSRINIGTIYDSTWKTIAHELGHNFGLTHAKGLVCDGGTIIDNSCYEQEYADKFSTMGIGRGHFNAFEKEKLGWIGYSQSTPPVTTVTSSGTYTIAPIESFGSRSRALKVLRGTDSVTGQHTWYYLEFRQPIGFDTYLFNPYDPYRFSENLNNGVLVHMHTEGRGSGVLLDMTPDSITSSSQSDLYDAALVIGDSYTDSAAGVIITPLSVDANGITVNISLSSSVNHPPIAQNDSIKIAQDKSVIIDVLANDNDPDGDSLSVTSLSSVNGSAVINSDNTITFTPASGFSGAETFSYTVSDGNGGTATANVSITVEAITIVNEAPVAAFTFSCSDLTCSFQDTSSDSDGTIASRSFNFGDGTNSTLASASHSYNSEGSYTVTLTVTDDDAATSSISKTITVTAPVDNTTIQLTTSFSKFKGNKTVTLNWTGATTTNVRIYRDGALLVTTPNDGHHENTFSGKATREWQICEDGTSKCSAVVTNSEK